MRRPATGLRSDRDARLSVLERASPAWGPWFALWRAAERAGGNPRSVTVTPVRERDVCAPLLHGATVHLDPRDTERLIATLAAAARVEWRDRTGALPLLEAALGHERESAPRHQEDGEEGLPAVLHFALPILFARIARSEGAANLAHWTQGYCPVCGAWPLRAELRGIERERHLRCGRCGADWIGTWLCCTYCGEKDHERLGLLSKEGQLESRRVETCSSCHRYLKAFAALTPASPLEMLLDDLETLELDLAARERGFSRPDALGYSIEVRVLPC
jgi:FdhE protein